MIARPKYIPGMADCMCRRKVLFVCYPSVSSRGKGIFWPGMPSGWGSIQNTFQEETDIILYALKLNSALFISPSFSPSWNLSQGVRSTCWQYCLYFRKKSYHWRWNMIFAELCGWNCQHETSWKTYNILERAVPAQKLQRSTNMTRPKSSGCLAALFKEMCLTSPLSLLRYNKI